MRGALLKSAWLWLGLIVAAEIAERLIDGSPPTSARIAAVVSGFLGGATVFHWLDQAEGD